MKAGVVLVETNDYKIYTSHTSSMKEDAGNSSGAITLNEDTMSSDQRARYFEICTWIENSSPNKDQVRTLGGYAGTGKTALIAQLAQKYERTMDIAYCAYTGKAANLLRSRLRYYGVRTSDVTTLHSLLYRAVTDDNGRVTSWEPRLELEAMFDLIVVDEASMVDKQLFDDLTKHGIPILAVGDHGQLPPVNGDFNLMEQPQLRLEKIHRQAESSPIIALSKHVRDTGRLPSSWGYEGQDVQIVSKREMRAVIDNVYSLPGIKPIDVGLLAFSNKMRVTLNRLAREVWWKHRFAQGPILGDVVICLRNVARRVFNGMRGELIWLSSEPIDTPWQWNAAVQFPDEGLRIEGGVCKPQFNRPTTFKDLDEYEEATGQRPWRMKDIGLLFDFGYALTVHKSQGSGFKYVILVDDAPLSIDADTYRRWLYTGITRASSHLVILR